jgi:hypothetical protein
MILLGLHCCPILYQIGICGGSIILVAMYAKLVYEHYTQVTPVSTTLCQIGICGGYFILFVLEYNIYLTIYAVFVEIMLRYICTSQSTGVRRDYADAVSLLVPSQPLVVT